MIDRKRIIAELRTHDIYETDISRNQIALHCARCARPLDFIDAINFKLSVAGCYFSSSVLI